MKTILLYVGAGLFLISCENSSNTDIPQNLPDDEMKARVEVEKILFEKETTPSDSIVADVKNEHIKPKVEPEPELPRQPGHGDPKGDLYVLPKLVGPQRPIRPDFHLPTPVDTIVNFPDLDADYPGGEGALKKFIRENIKYTAGNIDVQGKVYVAMIIGSDGKIRDAKVMRGGIEELNEEALRVVNSMPNLIPAKNNGKVVAAKVRLPINFDLY